MYREDPLTPDEREVYERDLIAFCDRELDLLGNIEGLSVLYAGGASPLWIEGLSQRIGSKGTLTTLDADTDRVEEGKELLPDAGLSAPVWLVAGDVFRPPSGRQLPAEDPAVEQMVHIGLLELRLQRP